jgi:hypothetical protein
MPVWISLVTAIGFSYAGYGQAAAIASGRNWRLQVDGIECEGSLMAITTRVRYLGPSGAVEAPVSRLLDGAEKRYLPSGVVWRSGSKPLAELVSSGGLKIIETGSQGEIQWRFQRPSGELKLEFGDIDAFHVSRKRGSACEYEVRVPKNRVRVEGARPDFPIHRGRYPCLPNSIIEAEYPPYLPRQLLLFGRGYLPNAREIDLPMGWASAQAYFYVGADDVIAVENAARRALVADFPEYRSSARYFAFNWGTQKAESGNDMYSIGVYEIRACPAK